MKHMIQVSLYDTLTLPVKLSQNKFCMSARLATAPDPPISIMRASGS